MSNESPESSNPLAYWRAHRDAQRTSKLSRSEYCRRNDLSMPRMVYWEGKLANATKKVRAKKTAFVRAKLASKPTLAPPTTNTLRLSIGSALTIECDTGVDPTWIVALTKAMGVSA